jgi:hypothetical protein
MNSSVKPDFSRDWVLDRQASHFTGGASALENGVLRTDHRDPKCGFQISMKPGGESVERAWESNLSDEIPVVDSGFYSRFFWEGMLWSLSAGRRALMRSGACCGGINFLTRANGFEQVRGRSPNFDNTWIFEKR